MCTTKTPCNNMAFNVCTFPVQSRPWVSKAAAACRFMHAALQFYYEVTSEVHSCIALCNVRQCCRPIEVTAGSWRNVPSTKLSFIHYETRFYCMLDKFSEHRKLEYTLLFMITLTKFAHSIHWALHRTRYIDDVHPSGDRVIWRCAG